MEERPLTPRSDGFGRNKRKKRWRMVNWRSKKENTEDLKPSPYRKVLNIKNVKNQKKMKNTQITSISKHQKSYKHQKSNIKVIHF